MLTVQISPAFWFERLYSFTKMSVRLFEGKEHATSYWKYRISPSEELISKVLQFHTSNVRLLSWLLSIHSFACHICHFIYVWTYCTLYCIFSEKCIQWPGSRCWLWVRAGNIALSTTFYSCGGSRHQPSSTGDGEETYQQSKCLLQVL